MTIDERQRGRALLAALFLAFLTALVGLFWLMMPATSSIGSWWPFLVACVFVAALLASDVRTRLRNRGRKDDESDGAG